MSLEIEFPDPKPLACALARAAAATKRRGKVAALRQVRICGGESGLWIIGTDIDVAAVERVRTLADLRGKIDLCVPPAPLRAFLRRARGPVTLSHPGGRELTLRDGDAAVTIPDALEGDTLPAAPPPPQKALRLELFAAPLRAALAEVARTVSTEETRYYLTGACLEIDGGRLRMTATDGHRLETRSLEAHISGTFEAPPLVPAKALAAIERLLAATAEPVAELVLPSDGKGHGALRAGSSAVAFQLIDGRFPDWRKVVPAPVEAPARAVRIARADFQRLEAARSRAPVILDPAAGVMSTRAATGGTFTAPISGHGDRCAYQGRYLAQAIGAREEILLVAGPEEAAPARIDHALPGDLSVIMGIRI